MQHHDAASSHSFSASGAGLPAFVLQRELAGQSYTQPAAPRRTYVRVDLTAHVHVHARHELCTRASDVQSMQMYTCSITLYCTASCA